MLLSAFKNVETYPCSDFEFFHWWGAVGMPAPLSLFPTQKKKIVNDNANIFTQPYWCTFDTYRVFLVDIAHWLFSFCDWTGRLMEKTDCLSPLRMCVRGDNSKSTITIGTKLHKTLEPIKLWDNPHYSIHVTFILKPVIAIPVSVKNIFSHQSFSA